MAELIDTIKDLLKEPQLREQFAEAPDVDKASKLLVSAGAKAGHDFSQEDVVQAIGQVMPPKPESSDAERHHADVVGSGCWNTYMHSELICNSRLCG